MKIKSQEGVGFKTNTNFKSMKIRLHANTVGRILRELYSNPRQTLVQEYLSNGRDASIEGGTNKPLQVTLPTKLENVLKIRDYGVGITPERMETVFVEMGSSTKTKSNDQVGGFGIGAKSGWAYSESFTIVSYTDGFKRTYSAHLGESSGGNVDLIDTQKSSEPNGTEIQIPVLHQDIEYFIWAVYRATILWKVQPVFKGLLTEEIPKFYREDVKKPLIQGSNWKVYSKDLNPLLTKDGNTKIFLSIDGIPYALDHRFKNLSGVKNLNEALHYRNTVMVIEVKTGAFEIPPNRESIYDNEANSKQVDDITTKICNEFPAIFKACADKTKTFSEFVDCLKTFKNNLNVDFEVSHKIKNAKFYANASGYIKINEKQRNVNIDPFFDQCFYLKSNASGYILSSKDSGFFLEKNFVIYKDDTNDGIGIIRGRIKNYLLKNTHKETEFILISPKVNATDKEQKEYNDVVEALDAKPLSSLERALTTRKAIENRAETENLIVINNLQVFEDARNESAKLRQVTETIKVESIKSKTAYIVLEDTTKTIQSIREAYFEKINYLNKHGIKTITLRPKYLEIIESNPNFVKFDEVVTLTISKNKMTQKQKNDYLSLNLNDLCAFSKIVLQNKSNIKNKKLVKILENHHEEAKKLTKVDYWARTKVEKLSHIYVKECEEISNKAKILNATLDKAWSHYPLIKHLSFYNLSPKDKAILNTEIIEYINNKKNVS